MARSCSLEGRGPWCSMEFAVAAFVYLLRCADGSYYVGSTRGSLDNRVAAHKAGRFGGYTTSRLHGRIHVVTAICPHYCCDRDGAPRQRMEPVQNCSEDKRG